MSRLPLAIGLLVAPALLLACGAEEDGGGTSSGDPRVAVDIVREDTVRAVRRWTGRLESLRPTAVSAPVSARVAELPVRNGERVGAGDLLVRLESAGREGRRDALLLRLEHLEDELDRWERLGASGAAGPAEVAEARIRVLEARAEVRELEGDRSELEVRAPAAGRVSGLSVSMGSPVVAGAPLLRLEETASFGIRLVVPSTEVRFLEAFEELRVTDDRGNSRTPLGMATSPHGHPGFVQVDLLLDGGEDGAVEVEQVSVGTALIVPWTSVAREGDGHWVGLVTGDPPTVERRSVELGRGHGNGVEVRSGLEPGDRVLSHEPRSLEEGRTVDPMERNPS